MARFRVLIPEQRTADPESLRRVGLPHLMPGAVFIQSVVNGKAGQIVSWGENDPYCDTATWLWTPAIATPDLPSGRYFVGIRKDSPPLPHELAWKKRFPGKFLTLGDGNNWCIPSAGLLPQSFQIGPDRQTSLTVRDEFKDYFDESAKWYLEFVQQLNNEAVGDAVNISFDADVFEFIARALAMNYMITPEVVSQLGLLGTDNLMDCILATISGLEIKEELELKKKEEPVSAG